MNNSGKQLSLQWIVVGLVVIFLGGMTFLAGFGTGFGTGRVTAPKGCLLYTSRQLGNQHASGAGIKIMYRRLHQATKGLFAQRLQMCIRDR